MFHRKIAKKINCALTFKTLFDLNFIKNRNRNIFFKNTLKKSIQITYVLIYE